MRNVDGVLVRNVVTLALFIGAAALARVAQEVALAWRFGVSATVDAYSFLMTLVNWPVSVWTSLLATLLVPAFAHLRQQSPARLPVFRAELLGASLIVAVLGGILFWLLLRGELLGLFDRLSPAVLGEVRKMADPLSFAVPLGVLASLLSVWMLAYGRHANTLFEAIPPVVIVCALAAFPDAPVEALIWGTLIGIGARLAVLWSLECLAAGIERPRFSFRDPQWSGLRRGATVVVLGQALMAATNVVDQLFAVQLGEGAVATFNYASRVVGLVAMLGATVIQRATLPVFSSAHAAGDSATMRAVGQWSALGFVAGAVIVILAVPTAPLLTRLAFERGAFSVADTAAVALIVRYYVFHIPFYFAGLVLVSVLVAKSMYRTVSVIAGLVLVSKFLANLALTPLLGLPGVALSSSIMYAVSLFLCYVAFERSGRKPRCAV